MPPHSLLKAALNLTSRLESMASWLLTFSIHSFMLSNMIRVGIHKTISSPASWVLWKKVFSELGESQITFFQKNCLHRWLWILHTASTDNVELQVPLFFHMCCGDCFLLQKCILCATENALIRPFFCGSSVFSPFNDLIEMVQYIYPEKIHYLSFHFRLYDFQICMDGKYKMK